MITMLMKTTSLILMDLFTVVKLFFLSENKDHSDRNCVTVLFECFSTILKTGPIFSKHYTQLAHQTPNQQNTSDPLQNETL